jgi:hypothetical protein
MRWLCLLSGWLVLSAASLRAFSCLFAKSPAATFFVNVSKSGSNAALGALFGTDCHCWMCAGSMINGAAGPFVFGLAPRISAIWFPISQRTIATSIGNLANALGR